MVEVASHRVGVVVVHHRPIGARSAEFDVRVPFLEKHEVEGVIALWHS